MIHSWILGRIYAAWGKTAVFVNAVGIAYNLSSGDGKKILLLLIRLHFFPKSNKFLFLFLCLKFLLFDSALIVSWFNLQCGDTTWIKWCHWNIWNIYMMFLHKKNFKKRCILLKTYFKITLFLAQEDWEQTAVFDYYKYDVHISRKINRRGLQKKLYAVVIFVATSLFSFFNLLFLKYVLKVLATFLASSKATLLVIIFWNFTIF